MNRSINDKAHGVIAKTMEDLDSIVTVLTVVSFGELDEEEQRAVARGALEMVSALESRLRIIQRDFSPDEAATAAASDDAPAGGGAAPN